MEITKLNFNESLSKIQKDIESSTFITIDCELTGLHSMPNNVNAFDSPRQYYEKVKKTCREFLVIQYGLAIFRYDSDQDVFRQQCYNFYVFRRPVNRNIRDQRFLCQTSSIDFLINQGFDFNKLFRDGVSYLNEAEEAKCKEYLDEQLKNVINLKESQQKESNSNLIPIPEDVEPFINNVIEQLQDFVSSDENEIQLPKCNAFVRRLLYQTAVTQFTGKISLETREVEKDRLLFATRVKSLEEQKQIELEKVEVKLRELDESVGFTKVLRFIINSGKLIVGHNLCLDLLHTVDKFLTPLPDDYQEFKDCAHSLFPKVLDTKYMSTVEPLKPLIQSNVLKDLLDTVSKEPFKLPTVEVEEGGQGYQINDNKEHEAGYDAFITGLSFLSMWKFLGDQANLPNNKIFTSFDLLDAIVNRIFLMRLTDNQFFHLGDVEIEPPRDHVFYLTFPKEWRNSNIMELFSPFGHIFIAWIDESSAYVSLHKKDKANSALKILKSSSNVYSICSFAARQKQLASENNSGETSANITRSISSPSILNSVVKRKLTSDSTLDESSEQGKNLSKRRKKKTNKTFLEDGAWE